MKWKMLKIAFLNYGYLAGACQEGIEVIEEGIEVINRRYRGNQPGDKIHIFSSVFIYFCCIQLLSSCPFM